MEYGWKDFVSVYGGPANASSPWKKYKKDHIIPKEFYGESVAKKPGRPKGSGKKSPPKKSPPKKSPLKNCPEGKVFNPKGTGCINLGGAAHKKYLLEGAYSDAITKIYAYLLEKKKAGRPKGSGKKGAPKKSPLKNCPEGKVFNPKGTGCINLGGAAHKKYLLEGAYDKVTTKKYAHLLLKKKSGRPKGSGKKKSPKKSPKAKICPEGKVLNPKGTGCINEGGAAHLKYLRENAYDKATTESYAHLLEKKTPKKRGRPKGSGKKGAPKKSPLKGCPEGKVLNPKGTGCIILGGDTHKKYLREEAYNKTTTAKYAYLLEKKKAGRPKGSSKKSPKKEKEYQDGDVETVNGKKKIYNGDTNRWIVYGGQSFVNRIREGGFAMLSKSEIMKYKVKSTRGRPKGSGKKAHKYVIKAPLKPPRRSPRGRSPVIREISIRSTSPRRKRSLSPVVFRSVTPRKSPQKSPRKSPRKVSPQKSPRKSPRKVSPRKTSPRKTSPRKVSPRRKSPLRKRSRSPVVKSPKVVKVGKGDEGKIKQIATLYGVTIASVKKVYKNEAAGNILDTLVYVRRIKKGVKTSPKQMANDIKKVMEETTIIQDFTEDQGWQKWYSERVLGTPLTFKEAVYELSKIKKD